MALGTFKGASVAKYIAMVVVVVALSVAAYFGLSLYRTNMNTPERVMERFANDLTREDSDLTYERLSDVLKKQSTPGEWREQTAPFRGTAAPALVSHEDVSDTFNTYPDAADPKRFVYKYRINGKDYMLTAILYKQGNSWLIDEFHGDYR